MRLCSFDVNHGLHKCQHDFSLTNNSWRWCGSNFDAFGNYRFMNVYTETYFSDLNWGFANFDNIGSSLRVVFQVSTKRDLAHSLGIYRT